MSQVYARDGQSEVLQVLDLRVLRLIHISLLFHLNIVKSFPTESVARFNVRRLQGYVSIKLPGH